MIPRVNFGVAAVLATALLAAAPAFAQETNISATPSTDSIGPSELSNFSLNGSVTRPADRPVQPAQPPQPAPAVTQPPAGTQSDRPAPSRPVAEEAPSRPTAGDRPGDLLARPPTLPQTTDAAPATSSAQSGFEDEGPAIAVPPPEQGSSILPWLAALLFAAGAGAIFWFLKQRRGERYATGHSDLGEMLAPRPVTPMPAAPIQARTPPAPEPVAKPLHDPDPARTEPTFPINRGPLPSTLMPKPSNPQQTSAPAAAVAETAPAPAPATVGIVSTGLRPWIDVELVPERALFDDQGAAIACDIILINGGNAPARDVTVEAQLLNAGSEQDFELSAMFGNPSKTSDPIPLIAPFARVSLRSAVRIGRDKIREYEVEGRKLFMPMVGVCARYRWSSGDGQTGAGFLVGRGKEDAERLAPLRIDQGSRSWNGLGARRYEKGVRR